MTLAQAGEKNRNTPTGMLERIPGELSSYWQAGVTHFNFSVLCDYILRQDIQLVQVCEQAVETMTHKQTNMLGRNLENPHPITHIRAHVHTHVHTRTRVCVSVLCIISITSV